MYFLWLSTSVNLSLSLITLTLGLRAPPYHSIISLGQTQPSDSTDRLTTACKAVKPEIRPVLGSTTTVTFSTFPSPSSLSDYHKHKSRRLPRHIFRALKRRRLARTSSTQPKRQLSLPLARYPPHVPASTTSGTLQHPRPSPRHCAQTPGPILSVAGRRVAAAAVR